MAWSSVVWAFKDAITSTKLGQMVENVRVHDHRSDGTQGDPIGVVVGPTQFPASGSVTINATSQRLVTLAVPSLKRPGTVHIALQSSNPTGGGAPLIVVAIPGGDGSNTVWHAAPISGSGCRWTQSYNIPAGVAGNITVDAATLGGANLAVSTMRVWVTA